VRSLFTSWLDFLLIFIPATITLELVHADPLLVFASAGLAIIPLAGLLGRATEHLTTHLGAGIGALLNASLGNAAELIIALVALREGLPDVVKATLTGSILGNILLVLGVAMFAGGIKYERQKFNQTAAGMGASLLLLAAVGLIIPALFHLTAVDRGVTIERKLSLTISFVLFAIYVASLLFTLRTHRHLFAGEAHTASDLGEQPWTKRASIYSADCGDLSRGPHERDINRCAGACFAPARADASLRRSHSGRTDRQCGRTFYSCDGGAQKQDGSRLWYCRRVKSADCAARGAIARLRQLSIRSAIGSDLHTV
jgi:Ca2+/H+ antiporter